MYPIKGLSDHGPRQVRGESTASLSEGHSTHLRVRTKRVLPMVCFLNSQKSLGGRAPTASGLGLPDHTDVNRHDLSAWASEAAETKGWDCCHDSSLSVSRCQSRHPPPAHILPAIHQRHRQHRTESRGQAVPLPTTGDFWQLHGRWLCTKWDGGSSEIDIWTGLNFKPQI